MDCIFCKIIKKELPAEIVYEDDNVLAIKDIHPQAPLHILLISKKHLSELKDFSQENKNIFSEILFLIYNKLAKDYDLKDGFRVINNFGKDGGQTVKHLHFHLLGKKVFGENF